MAKRRLPEDSKIMGVLVPPRHWEQAIEIQKRYGDVSVSQVWRKALEIGLAQLLRDVPKPQGAASGGQVKRCRS